MTRQLHVLRAGFLRWRRALLRLERGDVSFAVVALVVVFGSLLGIVVLQTFIVQNRVELDVITEELDEERERNQELRVAVIELEAPDRIMTTAEERLGMTRPQVRRYLPGIDPAIAELAPPPEAVDPFAPAPLPAELGGAPEDDEES